MTQKGNTVIESIGVYLPPNTVSTDEILAGCQHPVRFQLEKLTGIKSRRMVGESEFAIDLAKKAIEDCFALSKYKPEEIELLVSCNISKYDGPNFKFSFEPTTAIKLKKHFGFSKAISFDISNACAGMWTGIHLVDAFLKLGIIRCGMVVSGEYITHLTKTAQKEIKHFMDPRLACLTLGDAGAAIILERGANGETGIHNIEMYTLGKYYPYCMAKPSGQEHGGAIMLTDPIKLNTVSLKHSILLTEHVRHQTGLPLDAFQHLIMHQVSKISIDTSIREINSFYKKEVCHDGTVINNLSERANTATTTHMVALKDFILNDRIKSGDKIIFSITGSGVTIGAAFYTMDNLPDKIRENTKAPVQDATRAPASGRAFPFIRIESIGTATAENGNKNDSFLLARMAARDCLQQSGYKTNDIELLINTGIYRTEFISEPAIATIIAGELQMNEDIESLDKQKTFAFDLLNGSLGFLNACHVAISLIRAKKYNNAIIVASEIENNFEPLPDQLIGLFEAGSAIILDEDPNNSAGFGRFLFKSYLQYQDAFFAHSGMSGGNTYIVFNKDPAIYDYYLACIPDAVNELLQEQGLDLSQIDLLFPPQLSQEFAKKLATILNVPADKLVTVDTQGKDLYTSSIPYALRKAQDLGLAKAGKIGLIISIGSGLQVGCSIYYF